MKAKKEYEKKVDKIFVKMQNGQKFEISLNFKRYEKAKNGIWAIVRDFLYIWEQKLGDIEKIIVELK